MGLLFRAPQRLAGKVDAALLEVVAVVAGAVERIGQHLFRVMTVTRPIGFLLGHQVLAFVKGVPAPVIGMGQAITGQADAEFGAELDRFVELAAHDRSHIGLTDADAAMLAAAGFALVHVPLLLIQVLYHPVAIQQPTRQMQGSALRNQRQELFDVPEVATQILQLLFQATA